MNLLAHADLPPFLLPIVCLLFAAAMVFLAEVLRWTAPTCDCVECVRRLRWSHRFLLSAPTLLAILSMNQAIQVKELQQIAGVEVRPVMGLPMNHTPDEQMAPGTMLVRRNGRGLHVAAYGKACEMGGTMSQTNLDEGSDPNHPCHVIWLILQTKLEAQTVAASGMDQGKQ